MKNVLVTGANGFVGNHLVKELSESGYDVIGLGGQAGSREKNGYRVLDLTRIEEAEQINFQEVEWVIHLAGLAAVGPSFNEPMRYIDVNVGIEVNLFETALRQNTKPRFLIISSGALYDPKSPLPLKEDSPVLPGSPYAVSKLAQEQMASYYGARGFECVIARPFNHIGPGQNPGFIVPDLAQQIVEAEKAGKEKIFVGNLDAKRDYTDVRDIVRAYRLLMEKGRPGEIYNVCSGKSVSGHELLAGLLKSSGATLDAKIDPSKLRPADYPDLYGSNQKIYEHTAWRPQIELAVTLGDVMSDWRNRG